MLVFCKNLNLISLKIFSILIFFSFTNISFAFLDNKTSYDVCNVNSECPFGFVCINGDPSLVSDTTGLTMGNDSARYMGACTPTIPLRQMCYFYALITGKLGKAFVGLTIISFGILVVTPGAKQGDLIMRLMTLFLGVVLLFGGFQIIYFLVGERSRACELIDYSVPMGLPPRFKKNGKGELSVIEPTINGAINPEYIKP